MNDRERIARLRRAMARVQQLRQMVREAEMELRDEIEGAHEEPETAVRVLVMSEGQR